MDLPKPRRVYVWIRYPSKALRIQAHAIAYIRTAVLVELVDDLNGETAPETVRFAVDGVGYESGLTTESAGVPRSSITEYASKGRKAGNRKNGFRQLPSGVLGRCLWNRGRAEWSASDRATTGDAGTR